MKSREPIFWRRVDISTGLGRSLRTVHRVLAQAKERLQRILDAGDATPAG